MPLLPLVGMYLLAMVAGSVGLVALVGLGSDAWPPWIVLLPLLAIAVGWEAWMARRGVMVPTPPLAKRIARLVLAIVAGVVLFFLGFGVWIQHAGHGAGAG